MNLKNRTGYNQLRKTKAVTELANSSGGCASGTCDMRLVKKERFIAKASKKRQLLKELKSFERAA